MWKLPGVPMSLFVMTLTLSAFTRSETKTVFMYVMEGDQTILNFSFPCNSAEFTLRHGHKAPFYDSTNPESMPASDRYEIMLHNETENHNCSLQLEINPVHRSDAGGYIFTSYDGDGNFLEDSRIGLRVDYPPGVASCEWLGENIVDDWGSMLCKAPAGSTPGQFACYQNGQRLPHKTTPEEAGNVLQQTICVRYSQVAFCCAALEERIDMCKCKDFIWDPSHSGNIIDPCATPPQDSTSPRPEGDNVANSVLTTQLSATQQIITERPDGQKVYNSLYRGLLAGIGTLVFIIIILWVVLAALLQKIRQIRVIRQHDPYYETVPDVKVHTCSL